MVVSKVLRFYLNLNLNKLGPIYTRVSHHIHARQMGGDRVPTYPKPAGSQFYLIFAEIYRIL